VERTDCCERLLGTDRGGGDVDCQVITVMFDRKNFTAESASQWWYQNRERFIFRT
jgi:hypothetical protein